MVDVRAPVQVPPCRYWTRGTFWCITILADVSGFWVMGFFLIYSWWVELGLCFRAHWTVRSCWYKTFLCWRKRFWDIGLFVFTSLDTAGLLSVFPELCLFFTINNKYSNSRVGGGSFYVTLDDWQVGVACTRSANVLFFTGFGHLSLFKVLLVDIPRNLCEYFRGCYPMSKPASACFSGLGNNDTQF